MTTLNDDQQKSMTAAKKAERERDKAQALLDYEAEKRAEQANMMRLRALRLAKDVTASRSRSNRRDHSSSTGPVTRFDVPIWSRGWKRSPPIGQNSPRLRPVTSTARTAR